MRNILFVILSGYVDDIQKLLFTMEKNSMQEKLHTYKGNVPAPLNTQFEARLSKEDAIKRHSERKQMDIVLYPQG